MIARTSTIKHPLGIELSTPLLVPSFSSKGFAMHDGKSELCNTMIFVKEFVYEAQLLSAYDIYYKHMLDYENLNPTQITIIDSGGYETSNNFDLSETRKYDRLKKEWNIDLLNSVLQNWTEIYPAIVVCYDDVELKVNIDEQINNAIGFFKTKDQFLSDFLIKPQSNENNFIDIDVLLQNVDKFKPFDIIGITEKELGESYFQRMKNIFLLRKKLDIAGIESPIHIFGALDPISVVLYFIMGAEIFDGLSWLKYDYFDCCAAYINNSYVIKDINNIYLSDNEIRMRTLKDNIYQLEKLKNVLLNFSKENDFGVFNKFIGEELATKIKEVVQQILKGI